MTIGYKNRNPSKISKKIKTYWNAVDIKCCWDLHKTQSPTSIVVLHQDDIFPISVHDSDGTRLHRQSWLRRHHSKISFRCIKLGLVYTVSSPLLHTGCRKWKIWNNVSCSSASVSSETSLWLQRDHWNKNANTMSETSLRFSIWTSLEEGECEPKY